ncbi:DNA-directed RNA polymerase subunit G [Sulfuracidifex tepidarius]|uniref:DNA-directed RNA polymerase subunit Rpo8 n=1 Tax=Sulfuracidifex tepidarius TaxID=1294262 RepID=A0A510E578_9CREN|nr:DNA-directed RNA polymerase subunit G [Sulfuracidifex tepidarius]BBG24452.1 hypothetical protein IC006_1771 [Sulfuracidifex tepidarius]BBG27210.1 hypothetical protein IC007_1749 [Sulfuracidifex tepidarius]
MLSEADSINEECKVVSVNKTGLKGNLVVELSCDNKKILFDIIESINNFKPDEKVKAIISKNRPEFGAEDFCGHGYIVTQKKNEESLITIISLFGLLIKVIEDKNSNFMKKVNLNIMDHIYFCVRKEK